MQSIIKHLVEGLKSRNWRTERMIMGNVDGLHRFAHASRHTMRMPNAIKPIICEHSEWCKSSLCIRTYFQIKYQPYDLEFFEHNEHTVLLFLCCVYSIVVVVFFSFRSLVAVLFFIVIPRRLACYMHTVVVILAGKICCMLIWFLCNCFFFLQFCAQRISVWLWRNARETLRQRKRKKYIHRKIKTIHTRNESHKEFVIIILCVENRRSLSSLFSCLKLLSLFQFYFWIITAYHFNFCHPSMDWVKSFSINLIDSP